MTDKKPKSPEQAPAEQQPPAVPYEPPSIAWEEDFEPAAQATSCALLPGDCFQRPQS
jgi:hypothetical protein